MINGIIYGVKVKCPKCIYYNGDKPGEFGPIIDCAIHTSNDFIFPEHCKDFEQKLSLITKIKAKFRYWRLCHKLKKKIPKRCIDPVMKYCQGCKWGYCQYPEDTTRKDMLEGGVNFESGCTLGLENTPPTKRELRKFNKWVNKIRR